MKMKKKGLLLCLVLLLVVSMVAVGCGKKADPPPVDTTDPKANWPSNLALGTAAPGGVYFVYGGWASLVEEIVGIPTSVEATGGPADNMMLVHDGELQLGMITMGIGFDGWTGAKGTAFENDPHTNVRALFPMYSTYSHWWAHKDTGIKGLSDLEGKVVGVGPTGGTPGTYHPLILKLLGINADVVWGGTADQVESQIDGMIQANSQATGLPMGGLIQYYSTVGADNVVLFGPNAEERKKILAAYPYWTESVIPKATYDVLSEDLTTINVFNWAIAHKDLPENLVYEIVDAIMTNNDRMLQIHKAAAETLPTAIGTNTFLPLHPGAYKWFIDNGYKVPDGAKPID
ncbi:MAG: TAXI family TRAP transporter solute-binding subunit [Dethiobacter sp.]|nr:TAXI family TRAP transporter solute-binding subunit [Dethiobacter sp.]